MIYDFSAQELDEGGDLSTIHPIFHPVNFRNLTALEYAALGPSLALCSAYLAVSFDLQVFWQTILFGRRHDTTITPDWKFLTPPYPPFTEQNYHDFDHLLKQMAAMFDFQFARGSPAFGTDPWGATMAWDRQAVDPQWSPPPGINGFPSIITMSPIFLEAAVAAQAYLASVPVGATPHPDMLCLILRQQWFFAVTAVHELAHAINNAQMAHLQEMEPFFGGHRRAEVGYAWEQFAHGGQVSQVHGSKASDCGLSFASWPPGAERVEYIGPKAPDTGLGWNRRASRRAWNTEYIVPMEHIQKFHTRYFWESEVRRFGLIVMHIPKTLGLRSGDSSRAARVAAGSPSGVVSGGSSRDWSADHEGRVRRI